ncbi:MAG: efflux RND transporter periplasmic adaptor subunit [Lewinellaceae bacterium]|nr:efflux RND transporter periplasmic adaptor subunit [Lewinellaceae bacterium]
MKYIIKTTVITLGLVLAGCGKSADSETAIAAAAVPTGAKGQVTLTSEQLDLAGIEIGTPQLRRISGFVSCTGKVELPPQNLVSVHSPVKGFVRTVRFLPGNYIRKGDLLVTLAHQDLVRLQREYLETFYRMGALEKDYQRKQDLATADAMAQRNVEQAKADYQVAKAHLEGLRKELQMIGLSTKKLESDGTIQEQISLVSPINGYVNEVNANLGKLVNAEDLLYEILDATHVHAELRVYATDIALLKEGQRVEISVPGSDQRYPAEVHLISRMVDPDTKTVIVHGHFEPEPKQLLAGTFIEARIFTDEAQVLSVPAGAIVQEGKEQFVFVKVGSGFAKTAVQTGRSDGAFVEISGPEISRETQMALQGAYYLNGSLDADE